jgi:hypothetical protein
MSRIARVTEKHQAPSSATSQGWVPQRLRDSRGAYLIALVLVAGAVNLPSLSLGFYGDDYAHRHFILTHLRGQADHFPWWDMFDARLPAGAAASESGILVAPLPWWAAPDYTFRLLRPLSTATHYLDYILWPESSWGMHLHNVVLLCAAVMVAGALYWHLLPSRLAAWLALLLFALDGENAIGAGWIAGRNTIHTTLFSLLTLLAYARWRYLAPIFLLCAHASSEGAVVTWAYLIAFAICLDERRWKTRLLNLLPLAVITTGWIVLSAALGYEVRGSGSYVDPRVDLLSFLRILASRFPQLVQLQLGISYDYSRTLAPTRPGLLFGPAVVYVAVLLVSACIYGKSSRLVRFFALSWLGALVPQCAVGSFDRLLPLSSFAAHGLVVAVLTEVVASVRVRPNAFYRSTLTLLVLGAVWFGGPIALAIPRADAAYGEWYESSIMRATASLPTRHLGSRIIALNFPDFLRSALIDLYRRERFPPGPRRLDFVMISPGRVSFTRLSRDELELDAGAYVLIDPSTELVRRASDRFHVGQQFSLSGIDLEVKQITSDGRPSRLVIRGQNLDANGVLWVQWSAQQQRFVRFVLPPPGSTGELIE